jgi:uncharacterized protein YceK
MKKLMIGLVCVVLLSGCSTQKLNENAMFTRVFCDTEYGVEYIIRPEAMALRVSRDGTPVTCEMDGE